MFLPNGRLFPSWGHNYHRHLKELEKSVNQKFSSRVFSPAGQTAATLTQPSGPDSIFALMTNVRVGSGYPEVGAQLFSLLKEVARRTRTSGAWRPLLPIGA